MEKSEKKPCPFCISAQDWLVVEMDDLSICTAHRDKVDNFIAKVAAAMEVAGIEVDKIATQLTKGMEKYNARNNKS